MRYRVKSRLNFAYFKRQFRASKRKGVAKTAGLIRKEAREKIRVRAGASRPGTPIHAHTRGGMREINYDANEHDAIIGPRKFKTSNLFDKPATEIEEKGGVAFPRRRRGISRYPERSYMWSAVKRLQRRNKLTTTFAYTLKRNL